jgi:hypothetical protein
VSSSQVRAVADEMGRQVEQVGATTPAVRGADWRPATVATVNDAAGTVVTTDGVTARRIDSYQLPAVGDLIVLTQSGGGAWIADRQAPASGNGWQFPSFASPWGNYAAGGNYQVCRYRAANGELIIEGLAATTVSVTGTSTVFALPAAYRPAKAYVFASVTTAGASRQLNVFDTGLVQFTSLPAGTVAYASLNCRLSLI